MRQTPREAEAARPRGEVRRAGIDMHFALTHPTNYTADAESPSVID